MQLSHQAYCYAELAIFSPVVGRDHLQHGTSVLTEEEVARLSCPMWLIKYHEYSAVVTHLSTNLAQCRATLSINTTLFLTSLTAIDYTAYDINVSQLHIC